ncbi:MAG: ATP-binding cassette domain-containing protein, partial [Patescibacteria group bacterium]
GKTTFVKLLTGMLTPSSGMLSVRSSDDWSAVMQEPVKYTTFTVSDNVFLGDTSRSRDDAAIDAALAFSNFDGANKDALLGKDIGGTELSGGQWQKLAIARAVYRNRDMIILDEPTGNLDPLAEAEIFRKYIELSADKTVIFVTHRINAATLANRIIVFKGGRVIEDGSPDALLASGGEYARLYQAQSQWYDK